MLHKFSKGIKDGARELRKNPKVESARVKIAPIFKLGELIQLRLLSFAYSFRFAIVRLILLNSADFWLAAFEGISSVLCP